MFAQSLQQKLIWHYAGAGTHYNTAAMIEALFSVGPHGPVARDANSCVFCDSKHAAGICLGTLLARTHVQLPTVAAESPTQTTRYHAACVQSYRESGNECADPHWDHFRSHTWVASQAISQFSPPESPADFC